MNSVQENKNELEAAVRYCESAISRAKQTIESMEFRQQAATKAWHEQTGREAALEREVSRLRAINAERETMVEEGKEARADLLMQIEELKTNMALLTDEVEQYTKKYNELHHKKQAMEQTMQLQKDQIAMFQRKMSRMNEVDQ